MYYLKTVFNLFIIIIEDDNDKNINNKNIFFLYK